MREVDVIGLATERTVRKEDPFWVGAFYGFLIGVMVTVLVLP